MTDIHNAAAASIADYLRTAERDTDRAIASVAAVTMTFANARAETTDPALLATHGLASQKQLVKLGKLQADLIAKRSELTRVHGGMLVFGRQLMRLDVEEDCPSRRYATGGHLSLAAG